MKTLEEIKAMRDALAEAHASKVMDEGDWHSVEAGQSFILGFDKALELMEERERVAIEALKFTVNAAAYLYRPKEKLRDDLNPTFYHTLCYEGDLELKKKCIEARETLDKLTKGEK